MKILTIVSTYAPHAIGGAEVSAQNSILWLRDRGHEVAALTTAQDGEPELHGETVDGVRLWRLSWPRHHTHLGHQEAPAVHKLGWHVQDHFDPRNRRLMAGVLDEFNPDVALVRVITGIGYNSCYELAKRDIPTVYFLHDLNLICVRSDMFRNGQHCRRQCATCRIVSRIRFAAVSSVPRVSFCSPSQAILELASRYLPLHKYRSASILNANKYPVASVERQSSDALRFLYVGRLHSTKGVEIVLEAARLLADEYAFTLTIVGSGPQEAELRERYADRPWCRFAGQVTQTEVANFMANSDVLCIPSIWMENSPGVVIHAISKGLPVIGSDTGGIPEYVRHDGNGLLVRPRDIAAWRDALANVLTDHSLLDKWRAGAKAQAGRFDQNTIGEAIVNHMVQTIEGPRAASA